MDFTMFTLRNILGIRRYIAAIFIINVSYYDGSEVMLRSTAAECPRMQFRPYLTYLLLTELKKPEKSQNEKVIHNTKKATEYTKKLLIQD